ncbi:hypothetical protein K501DRAFT_247573 [Backusella circina FSU 941]|nr:hypothetical protein K501DRAFT_247573 [Backusella circina FSU 941]
MSNPFEDHNAWGNGPAHGNAYENTTSPPLPARNKPPIPNRPTPPPSRPTPPAATYQQNAWEDSNKVLDESYTPTPPVDAYQYSGTPYGNTSLSPTPATATKQENDVERSERKRGYRPSRLRILIRIIMLIASVGYLGFSAGASPYSGEDIPFDSSACFYFLYAVGAFSFTYSLFHVIFYFVRWFGSSGKMKRPLLIIFDLFMCLMWGIGIVVEISQFKCSPGGYNHWCDFYNTSIFFGFLSFVAYIIALGWDVFGACRSSRK